ncbi:MAG: hypothetical protein GYA17_17005 [Chloroflexi bacterium]|nr:hypothetical protein [Chloroflexota bacterium]
MTDAPLLYDPFSAAGPAAPVSHGLQHLRGNTLWLHGRRVPLLSGEVQFFRMDPAAWEPSLRQVKALGLPIVSTYLSWRRFSLGPGKYDLTGETDPRLDLPAYLDLCRQMGLWVTFKPGPWICAEETNGGFPDWLVNDPGLQVLDAGDRPVQGYNPPFQSPIPSYLHPRYQEHVRAWLQAVDRVAAPYCYPHGPILLVQLDNEPGYTFHDRMFESDYNPYVAAPGGLYARWLQAKYTTLQQLNHSHGSAWPAFEQVEPPRALEVERLAGLPRYLDWVEFKEWTLAQEVRSTGWYHLHNGLDQVLFTINYNEHPQLGVPNHWQALEQASGIGGFDYYPRLPMQPADFVSMVQALNYSRTVNRLPWSPEIMTGIWSFEGQEHDPQQLEAEDFEYLYLTCLAYGLKGMNFYMLADRDHWVNSPLNARGERTPTARAVEKTVQLMQTIPNFYDLEIEQPVAVIYHRPYAREAFVAHENPACVEGYRLGSAYAGFTALYTRLVQHNYNPAVADLWAAPQRLEQHRLAFFPAGPTLEPETQQRLVEYVRQGGRLVVLAHGAAPDPAEAPCARLAAAAGHAPGAGTGAWQQLGAGCWLELPGAELSSEQLTRLLEDAGLRPAVAAGAPGIQTVLHHHAGQEVLFVLNPLETPQAATLTFRDRESGLLVELPGAGQALPISGAQAYLHLAPRTVKVLMVRPGSQQ